MEDYNIRKIFGERIRKLRKKAKISQEKLGEKAKLHPTYIGMVERGEKSPTLDTIVKLAKALDVSLLHLFCLTIFPEEDLLKSEILSLIDKRNKTQKQLVLKILRGIFQK